eukprot:8138918-Pyramimonas_sp.AAC.1
MCRIAGLLLHAAVHARVPLLLTNCALPSTLPSPWNRDDIRAVRGSAGITRLTRNPRGPWGLASQAGDHIADDARGDCCSSAFDVSVAACCWHA